MLSMYLICIVYVLSMYLHMPLPSPSQELPMRYCTESVQKPPVTKPSHYPKYHKTDGKQSDIGECKIYEIRGLKVILDKTWQQCVKYRQVI